MIQLNDSESLVSVLEGFSDHRARASWRHTNLLLFPAWAPNPYSGSERWAGGGGGPGGVGGGEKVQKPVFAISFRFERTSPSARTPLPTVHTGL